MLISVITVTKNSERTIERTVRSVLSQQGVNVEHIIKDAMSDDRTVEIAMRANPSCKICQKNDLGIYDAMNQGFSFSTGDIVAFLNSDDYYHDENVLSDVSDLFKSTGCDYVYGNISFVSESGKIVREWCTGLIGEDGLHGTQIPHPAFFVRREVLNSLSPIFDTSFRIAGDLKQQLIIINKLNKAGSYLNRILTVMEIGGESTRNIKSYLRGWSESYRAYREVEGHGGLTFVIRKVMSKIHGVRPF